MLGRLTVLVIAHWSHWTIFLETSILLTVLAVLIELVSRLFHY